MTSTPVNHTEEASNGCHSGSPPVIFDFSGLYHSLKDGVIPKDSCFIDLSDIPGTLSYCDDSAVSAIKERIKEHGICDCRGIHLTDNGNYHYMSHILTGLNTCGYELIVFDHHTDMMTGAFGDILSCGGWIRSSLVNDKNLKRVICTGADEDLIRQTLDRDPVIMKEFLSGKAVFSDAASIEEKIYDSDIPVYLSLDLDVLSENELKTNWDQGDMPSDELISALNHIKRYRNIIGIDICGGPSAGRNGEFDVREMKLFGAVLKRLLDCLYCKIP